MYDCSPHRSSAPQPMLSELNKLLHSGLQQLGGTTESGHPPGHTIIRYAAQICRQGRPCQGSAGWLHGSPGTTQLQLGCCVCACSTYWLVAQRNRHALSCIAPQQRLTKAVTAVTTADMQAGVRSCAMLACKYRVPVPLCPSISCRSSRSRAGVGQPLRLTTTDCFTTHVCCKMCAELVPAVCYPML